MEALYGDRVDVRLELYFVVEDCLHEILDNNVTSFRFAVESLPEQRYWHVCLPIITNNEYGIYMSIYALFWHGPFDFHLVCSFRNVATWI